MSIISYTRLIVSSGTSWRASTVMFLLAAALVIKDLYAFFADSAKYSSSSVVNALEVLRTFEGEKKEGRVIRRKKTC